jgi:hypothetical protein
MATLRYLVSGIRSKHRLLSADAVVNDRVIASEIKANTYLLVKRETNLRKLWNTSTIFTTIPCLEMKNVSISECCDFVDSHEIARSRHKLPNISEGNYQYLIQGVYSINAMGGKGRKLKEITVNRYMNLLKLPFTKKEEYYWIMNNYLYITSSMVKKVRISAMFEGDVPNEILYPDCDCGEGDPSLDELCKNPLDKRFELPGYLGKQVMELTKQSLLETYFSIKNDNSNEGLDEQAVNINKTK